MAIERPADQTQLGEIKWLKASLIPRAVGRRVGLGTSLELPETFEVFLTWIVVQDDYRNSD
jgi:hypothetical protein